MELKKFIEKSISSIKEGVGGAEIENVEFDITLYEKDDMVHANDPHHVQKLPSTVKIKINLKGEQHIDEININVIDKDPKASS